jgi:surfactin synthase thioesterase subunit
LAGLKPPHNIQSAALDIVELIEAKLGKWPNVIMGHSLGGKVALEFVEGCSSGRYGSSAVVPNQASLFCKLFMEI